MYLSEELIAPGGPSAPVWAFFTALVAGVITLIAQQLKARSVAKTTREEAVKARHSAEKAQSNTHNVSNGFTGRMDANFDRVFKSQEQTTTQLSDLQRSINSHLEWHLKQKEDDK